MVNLSFLQVLVSKWGSFTVFSAVGNGVAECAKVVVLWVCVVLK